MTSKRGSNFATPVVSASRKKNRCRLCDRLCMYFGGKIEEVLRNIVEKALMKVEKLWCYKKYLGVKPDKSEVAVSDTKYKGKVGTEESVVRN